MDPKLVTAAVVAIVYTAVAWRRVFRHGGRGERIHATAATVIGAVIVIAAVESNLDLVAAGRARALDAAVELSCSATEVALANRGGEPVEVDVTVGGSASSVRIAPGERVSVPVEADPRCAGDRGISLRRPDSCATRLVDLQLRSESATTSVLRACELP